MEGGGQATLADGLAEPRRLWALLAVNAGVVMTVMDSAIANVALPAIARHLHAQTADAIWVVNAYQISMMLLLLPFSSAGEILGYRRVGIGGLLVFTAASAWCALAGSLPMLVAARVVQGVGGAAVLGVNSALLRFIYPQALLGRSVGTLAFSVGVSASIGPSVASGILSVASWPYLFAVNVPLGVVAVLVAVWALPRVHGSRRAFDWGSAALSALSLGLLVVGVDAIGRPRARGLAMAEFAAAVGCGGVLVARQRGRVAPLLPVDLLRVPAFALAIATSICSFAAQTLAYVGLPFFLEYGMGHGQVATGLLITPWPLATGLTAPVAGRLADRAPAGLLAGIGMAVMAVGTLGIAVLPRHPGTVVIVALMAACGFGFGLFQAPNNRAVLAATPMARSGGANGMLGTARTLGQTLGAALVSVIFARAGDQASARVLGLAAAVAALAAVISLSRLRVPGG